MEYIISKYYIEQHYKLAFMDYIQTTNCDEKQISQRTMARLERIAMEQYGFEYADYLHKKFLGV